MFINLYCVLCEHVSEAASASAFWADACVPFTDCRADACVAPVRNGFAKSAKILQQILFHRIQVVYNVANGDAERCQCVDARLGFDTQNSPHGVTVRL